MIETRYTYDDLAKYFDAMRKFNLWAGEFNDPVYTIIRIRMKGYDHWNAPYVPVVKRN